MCVESWKKFRVFFFPSSQAAKKFQTDREAPKQKNKYLIQAQ